MKRSPSRSKQGLGAAGALALVAGLGCSTTVSGETEGGEPGTTRALIRIERIETLEPEGARALALAHFAQVNNATPQRALELLDLREVLPEVGSCLDGRTEPTTAGGSLTAAGALAAAAGEPSAVWTASGQVELLEAGEVTISTPTQITSLAPRAFPTVRDLVSGVVYSTRDQAAEPLPSGMPYRVSASGSSVLAPFDVTAEAPEALAGVQLGDLSLGELSELSLGASLPLRWSPGQAGDWVVFELTDGLSRVVCSFDDRAGQGLVPGGAVEGSGLSSGFATLSVHRVRVATFGDEATTLGEIRFDFELATKVLLTR